MKEENHIALYEKFITLLKRRIISSGDTVRFEEDLQDCNVILNGHKEGLSLLEESFEKKPTNVELKLRIEVLKAQINKCEGLSKHGERNSK